MVHQLCFCQCHMALQYAAYTFVQAPAALDAVMSSSDSTLDWCDFLTMASAIGWRKLFAPGGYHCIM